MTTRQKFKHMKKKAQVFVLSEWMTLAVSAVGSLLYCIGVSAFTLPYRFPDTGVMGIAVILKYTLGIAPSLITLTANVLLLVWGGRELSKRFVAWTIFNVVIIAFYLQALSLIDFPRINDMFLVAIAGGVLKGVGGGMVFRVGASMGGLDIIAAVMRRRFGVEIGQISFYINMVILAASTGVVGIEKVLYGFVASYIVGQSMDGVLSSFDKRRLVLIVTQCPDEIVGFIADHLHRGCTMLHSKGSYSGGESETLMTLLSPRQAMVLKRYLARNFPRSFMVISDASEVLGNGFKRWKNI